MSIYTCRYACSWSRLSPSTDGFSGEGKDLWVFYFTTLPDLSGQLAPELKGKAICTVKPLPKDTIDINESIFIQIRSSNTCACPYLEKQ